MQGNTADFNTWTVLIQETEKMVLLTRPYTGAVYVHDIDSYKMNETYPTVLFGVLDLQRYY